MVFFPKYDLNQTVIIVLTWASSENMGGFVFNSWLN